MQLQKLYSWRWGLYAAILVTTFAQQAITVRYGWWPVGALAALIPILLVALAILMVREARG